MKVLMISVVTLLLAGCSQSYTKVEHLKNGSTTVTNTEYTYDFWQNLGEPMAMKVTHEKIERDGTLIFEADCSRKSKPWVLVCQEVK